MRTIIICIVMLSAASAQAAALSDVAGRWAQSSSGKELVLQSKIKLQPNVSGGFGTSLGGSVGFGSMTKTTVVTEAVPAHVDRRMELKLATDGGFTWTIVKTEPVDATCTRTVRQEKHGKARLASGSLVFDVAGGSETFEKSCGGTGRTALPASREAYRLTLDQGRMTLADGASKWVFARN
ncbi:MULTISPECIES: hypothetical protein [Asticcacaulis]|uniref:hypothetical protein n=1 Tax=Asticcacaulis TaxID=76890 RepID=UPI001AE7BA0B|nr:MULTISPECIES: hypothetical protein [Asticcacaulis]MBP2161513.1 hypothetical protein [Asticcacaulis solisilvae]MDR6802558.1 hypothetical protein [Asticcacaulis sp. BE141]